MFKKVLKQKKLDSRFRGNDKGENQVRGFTMIELLVSISVFAVIVAIVSGIFITSLRSNRTSVALITANSDGQLALEQMIRMIRKGDGKSFIVEEVKDNNDPASNYDDLKYKCIRFTYSGKYITYRWNKDGKKLESNIVPNLPPNCNSATEGIFKGIISDNLRVDFADFKIIGQGNSYPLITIGLRVGAKKTLITSGGQAFINLQTSVSPRSDYRY